MSATLYGYRLRAAQERVLDYRGGRMGVAAVPGAGKTLTLSLLAARLIEEGRLGDDGEVLVVTVQNSAVSNISQRIRQVLEELRLPPVGYRVCTLHKLAADIVRRRLDLAGTEETFAIIDGAESGRLMGQAVNAWVAGHRAWWESHLPEERRENTERQWRQETERVGREVAKLCKHLQLTPEAARQLLAGLRGAGDVSGFLTMGVGLYTLYTEYIRMRGGLDFDDLIWRATDALTHDPTFVAGLRRQWPYILEDEAQDSSPLQERILDTLAGPEGHWVRVGDANQSINSTFTAADPRYFRRFLEAPGVIREVLPESGRCGRPIIDLANRLVKSVCAGYPDEAIRLSAFDRNEIRPTEPGDPQPNPDAAECWIGFAAGRADTDAEAREVAGLAARYVSRYPRGTCAILCPTQGVGSRAVAALAALPNPPRYDDLLQSTPAARSVAATLAAVLRFLGQCTSPNALASLYSTLHAEDQDHNAEHDHPGRRAGGRHNPLEVLVRSAPVERLLFPRDTLTVQEALGPGVQVDAAQAARLEAFARRAAHWVRASSLPVDQLLLTVAQDLYGGKTPRGDETSPEDGTSPEDETSLAICHALASSLRALLDAHPSWRLADATDELVAVARNQRALSNLALTDAGYVSQPGTVVVTTMHKAKGLEWDMVFLMGLDSLEFPAACGDHFRDGPYFMGGRAPAVEARKQLEQLAGAQFATRQGDSVVESARREYIAERLRLLYVGITRARKMLYLSYSKSRSGRPVGPAAALEALRAFRSEQVGSGR